MTFKKKIFPIIKKHIDSDCEYRLFFFSFIRWLTSPEIKQRPLRSWKVSSFVFLTKRIFLSFHIFFEMFYSQASSECFSKYLRDEIQLLLSHSQFLCRRKGMWFWSTFNISQPCLFLTMLHFCFVLFCWYDYLLETGSPRVAHADLELTVLLWAPEFWHVNYVPLFLANHTRW